ncbi:unnamed protein product [[Actinomadura] parvosata subsp. kistnae]|uniref:hypothetical protein n=1 Tax=[Actinomadura] parvosata TaxID=1955412 RepID=UPI000D29D872|nr:unnamed protein product [Actinomadura parvosata subsp. kistnae]
MAQLSKGQRDTSTFAVPSELRRRIEDAGQRHGYTQPGVYLADLISALHPEQREDPERAASVQSAIPMLLGAAQVPVSGGRHVFTFRTPLGVKPRIKSAYKAYGYSRMTAYLVTLMSALHPEPKEGDHGHDGRGLAPEAARSLVGILLSGGADTSAVDLRSTYEQQSFLDVYGADQPRQSAA